MKLSIIIPARDEAALLLETLRAVQMARTEIASELIVVDNNSTDATPEIAQAAGAVVVHETKQTAAAARNAGAAVATGDWLLFLDADTSPTAELLVAMLAAIRTDRYDAGGCSLQCEGRENFGITLWNSIAKRRKRLTGAFLFIRNSTFCELGGFNPDVANGEEWELSRKLSPARIIILSQSLLLKERSPLAALS